MNTHKITPKDFFVWAGAVMALYGSVVSFIALLFSYIDQAYPDALSAAYNYDPYSGGVRFSMACLIVLVPVSLALLQMIRSDMARNPEKADLWIRRWALYLTIFLAGITVVIDLITLINYFLGGELTTRFIFKIAIVLLVASAVFMHFLADLWGFWAKYPARARSVALATGILVIATLASGFLIIGTPNSVRLARFDMQKVSDLQSIQYQITNYYQTKGKLPASLSDLSDALSGTTVPHDPQTGAQYEYDTSVKKSYSFVLCANFNGPELVDSMGRSVPVTPGLSVDDMTWTHGPGKTCFLRTIDPERYPQFPKGNQPIPVPAAI